MCFFINIKTLAKQLFILLDGKTLQFGMWALGRVFFPVSSKTTNLSPERQHVYRDRISDMSPSNLCRTHLTKRIIFFLNQSPSHIITRLQMRHASENQIYYVSSLYICRVCIFNCNDCVLVSEEIRAPCTLP